MSNQLIKTTGQGKENVFPRTRIQDLFDDTSGQKLIDILKSFNMMFVPYLGNKSYTRNQISPELRRQGLWLTYVIDNTVYTEWYDEVAIDDTNWGSDSNWRQGSNALVGDLSISPNGTWVINGEDSGITIKGDKGDSPIIRIQDNKIQVSYDKGVTYEDLNNTPIYTKFRFNSQTNTYQVSYDLGANWQDISNEKVYHKFKYNQATNTYQESTDFGKTWSNISAEKVYTKFRFNRSTNTYQVSTDLGQNWTDISSDKVYYQFRYNEETNTHQVSTDFGTTWTNVSEDKVFYQFRTEGNRLQVSTDLGTTWENCSEPIAAWFRWANVSGTSNIGKVQISRDNQTWSDLSPTITNNLYIKGYVSTVGELPTSSAVIGDIYMVGPTYDESDTTHNYPHYRMWVKQSSGWVDNGEFTNAGTVSTSNIINGAVTTEKIADNTVNTNIIQNGAVTYDKLQPEIKESVAGMKYVNNPEFLFIKTDSEDHLLWWIKRDGTVDWEKGVPTPIQEELKKLEQLIKDNTEGDKNVIARVAANEASIALINNILDKKIDGVYITNPEFKYLIVDANDNILFGINNYNKIINPQLEEKENQEKEEKKWEHQRKLIGVCYFNGWSGKCYYKLQESNQAFLNSALFDENSPYYDEEAKNYTDWVEYTYAKEGIYPPSHITFYMWYPHLAPTPLPSRKPTLSGGWRVDTVQRLEEEIELAYKYSIDYFLFCFYPVKGTFNEDDTVNEEVIMSHSLNSCVDLFLKAKNKNKLQFAIMLELTNKKLTKNQFFNLISFIYNKFATQENYLLFDGAPFLGIYTPNSLQFDINLATSYGKFNCYSNSMTLFKGNGTFIYSNPRLSNNISTPYMYNVEMSKYVFYPNQTIVNANVGWDRRLLLQPDFYTDKYLEKPTKEEFKEMLKVAIKHTKKQHGDKSILIYAWNEYGEGGWLVPTEGEREVGQEFFKLEAIKEIKKQWINNNIN